MRTVVHGANRASRNKIRDAVAHSSDDADGLKASPEGQEGERLLLTAEVLAAREVHVAVGGVKDSDTVRAGTF